MAHDSAQTNYYNTVYNKQVLFYLAFAAFGSEMQPIVYPMQQAILYATKIYGIRVAGYFLKGRLI